MTQNKSEFNSEYCNVKYVEQDNVVLLVWKKFCCFEDYRLPTMFAANLLHKHKGSNFVIDARNGFEDDKSDVEWGFSVLLPYMAKSDCLKCIFILQEIPTIEDEIDLWTAEFKKYFQVYKVPSYDETIEILIKKLVGLPS